MDKSTLKKKTAVMLLISTSFLLTSCDDAGVVNNTDSDYCISGTISGWNLGTKTLHAYLRNYSGSSFSVANCPISSDGSFNLCLPASVPDSALFTSDSIFYIGCSGGNVVFNPPDVKGTEIISFKVKNGDTLKGYLKCNNYSTLFPGAFLRMYIWVNKDVSVIGTKYCTSDTLIFDGSASAGWNKVIKHYLIVDPPDYKILYNTSEPAGAVWKYTSY